MCLGACINVRSHIRAQSSPATLCETGSLVCFCVHEASQPSSFRNASAPVSHLTTRILGLQIHTICPASK